MSQLNPREKQLLTALFGAIFLAANLFLLLYLKKTRQSLNAELSDLAAQSTVADAWLAEGKLWQERRNWLEKVQPRFPSAEDAQTALQQRLQDAASALGLEVSKQLIDPVESEAFYRQAAIRLQITGEMEKVVRWLVELQQPAKFQSVTDFSLRSGKEAPTVICDLRVALWYVLGTGN